ncbi:MAG: NAD+ synthetase, partial [Verrucomicrobiales bacterium]|nr:NAD+ synthetase [Verrucomicrobiales bacterium]
MNYVKLAAVSLNQTPLDWSGNSSRLREAIAECRNAGAELICLPELAITGYGCEDQFLAPSTCDQALNRLARLLPETRDLVVAVGLPLQHQNAVYNVVALISDGRLLGFYAKQNLAGDGIHYEQRWFRAWPTGQVARIDILGETVPLGDVTFEVGGRRIGFEACEDAWVANRPGRNYSKVGIDIILNPSASHFAFGKHRIREQFACEGSRAFGAAYVYANLLGNESGRVIFDGGSLIASGGELLAGAPRLSFKDIEIITATVNLDLNRLNQARTMSREVDPLATCTVTTPHTWTGCAPGNDIGPAPELSKEEEFTLAVCLGLFDYMRKSHSNGFIVSLSGGADSAAVASLVFLMHHLAVEELSEETFLSRLPQFKGAINMSDLLLCAYQATKNSGEVTRNAAAKLAEALGADYAEWDVQPAVDHYIQLAESTAGRTLNWEDDDITLQNIQARVRAPGIWMQANLRNALLLSTSNRSEAAV